MFMKIAYLGLGIWGFCLARHLAKKGYDVVSWSREEDHIELLNRTREHPRLPKRPMPPNGKFTSNMQEALDGATLIVESVTSAGIRPVFEEIKRYSPSKDTLICLTSKGIEQKSGLILSEVAASLLGEEFRQSLTLLSGPSFADEVSQNLPTSVVCGGYLVDAASCVAEVFSSLAFRVYPNSDIAGVSFGGALKNIIAIACGISDGLGFGTGAKATLMTRGLHEIVKLGRLHGCRTETFYGLSGMGDLFLTCSSITSRNYRFGTLLGKGMPAELAKKEIQMVVEGAYTAVSALQLGQKAGIEMPITEAVMSILDGKMTPQDASISLMKRSIKEECL
jgi:glycerol-3-phosphate dehydrogenase (NAD(P)+)